MDKKFCLNFFVLAMFFAGILSASVSKTSDDCADPIKTGFCMAYFEKFAYNSTSGKCEKFIYGGCNANKNNFDTLSACQETCQGICSQERKTGLCRASIPVYGYDAKIGKCVQYTYGGCGGTGNKFSSAENCEKVCK